MIQRVQSIYLALAVLCALLPFFLPFSELMVQGGIPYDMTMYGVHTPSSPYLAGINNYFAQVPLSLAALLTLVAVFLFGNRRRQVRVIRFTFLLIAIYFVLVTMYIFGVIAYFSPDQGAESSISFSTPFVPFLPFLTLVFNLLASRAIRKDEELVRSVDRIR